MEKQKSPTETPAEKVKRLEKKNSQMTRAQTYFKKVKDSATEEGCILTWSIQVRYNLN